MNLYRIGHGEAPTRLQPRQHCSPPQGEGHARARTTGGPRKRRRDDDRRVEKAIGPRVTIDGPVLTADVRRPTSVGRRPGLDDLAAAPARSEPSTKTLTRAPATASAETALREIARLIRSPFQKPYATAAPPSPQLPPTIKNRAAGEKNQTDHRMFATIRCRFRECPDRS